MRLKGSFLIGLLCLLMASVAPHADAFWGTAAKALNSVAKIVPSANALPDEEIIRLSKIAGEQNGTRKVGELLGTQKLSNEVLEDTFIRIAVHQGRLDRSEAEKMFLNLTGVPGFRTTLRKIIGNSDVGTAGHLYELKLANHAVSKGFKVIAIGEKFDDGLKRAPTDIDVILRRGDKTLAIEAKNYGSSSMIPMDRYRTDLDSLVAYRKARAEQNTVLIFSVANRPEKESYLKALKSAAKERDVELIFGDAQTSIEQINVIGKI